MSINKLDHLIFVGFNGYVTALDRDTGEIVWSQNNMKSGYVTLLLDGDRLVASTNGYLYCLNPYNGEIIWHNPMSGYGFGPAAMVSVRGQSDQSLIVQAAAVDAQRRAANTSIAASS